jgi:hypothetical protein
MALFIVKRQKTCAKLILQLILIHDSGGNYFTTCDGVGEERKKVGGVTRLLLKMTGVLMNPGIWPSDTISLCRLARKSLAGMNWRRKTILFWSDLIMIGLRKSRSRLKFLFDETTTLAALHLVFTRLVTFSASRVKLFLSFARAPSHQAHQDVFQLALALY